MARTLLLLILLLPPYRIPAQTLKLPIRPAMALTGSEFARSVADSTLSQTDREKRILREIRSGNVPAFFRTLVTVSDSARIAGQLYRIDYSVLPDYLAIGSDDDYFYCPMTPVLAQKVARLMDCVLPTRKMSDRIYLAAPVKMTPEPIPPSPAMITVPVFLRHTDLVRQQREKTLAAHPLGTLVAGNKKDIVLSNKIYRDGKLRVVIYGWHQPGGKPIQPLYNGHTADWADYSHGVRLIAAGVRVNGKKMSIRRVLQSRELSVLLSDEGPLQFVGYPAKQL
ncbi:MAG TPA: hypothetical protein VGE15_01045 [Sphingobacteriaceae bacterium]